MMMQQECNNVLCIPLQFDWLKNEVSKQPYFHEYSTPMLEGGSSHPGYKIRGSTHVRAGYKVHLLQQHPKLDHRHVPDHLPAPTQLPEYKLRPTSHPTLTD